MSAKQLADLLSHAAPIELIESAKATLREQEAVIEGLTSRLAAYESGTASQCARAAIRSADQFIRERDCARSILQELVTMINEDRDGSFFICKEAEPIIEAAMREARK